VPDPGGRRVGSGGSTLRCLETLAERGADLQRLRVLIIHAGGDSKRLPAYGPCGKIFVPVPGECSSAAGVTLFDRLAGSFLALPPGRDGQGQVVVTSGDALLLFDHSAVRFAGSGMTALGCYAAPAEAARHGVFSLAGDGTVRLYLQKPPVAEQASTGAIGPSGQTVLDAGVMSFDAATAAALLEVFGGLEEEIMARELDLYREICCAMGSETTLEHYLRNARASGSRWPEARLAKFYPILREIPFHAQVLSECGFLHFGATRELVPSGVALIRHDRGVVPAGECLTLNNEFEAGGTITGADSWVEGCRVRAPLALAGRNVVVGVDVDAPLALPEGACLDMVRGVDKWFVRCYGVDDAFKDARFHGRLLAGWLAAVGVEKIAPALWDAPVFPAVKNHADYRRWLWMFDVDSATPAEKQAFLTAERFSAAQLALLADQDAFHLRRMRIREKNAQNRNSESCHQLAP
jgi:fucokinase